MQTLMFNCKIFQIKISMILLYNEVEKIMFLAVPHVLIQLNVSIRNGKYLRLQSLANFAFIFWGTVDMIFTRNNDSSSSRPGGWPGRSARFRQRCNLAERKWVAVFQLYMFGQSINCVCETKLEQIISYVTKNSPEDLKLARKSV